MRKTWQKPKLVVLVRGRPEEFVLGQCKDTGATGGPVTSQLDCIENMMNCELCSELGAS